ncbi:WD repeat-containing protein 53 [Borealophlyctis nickersoniae]|nr:WD repeat-containing protein 53 [Borealophlyctis nickersoniae]
MPEPNSSQLSTTSLPTSLRGHSLPVQALSLPSTTSPTCILSASEDKTARLWSLQTLKTTKALKAASSISCAAITSDERLAYLGAADTVLIYDLRTPAIIETQSVAVMQCGEDEVNAIQLKEGAEDRYLATADDAGAVSVIDLRTRRSFKHFRSGHENIVSCVAFRPKNAWEIWSGGYDSCIRRPYLEHIDRAN